MAGMETAMGMHKTGMIAMGIEREGEWATGMSMRHPCEDAVTPTLYRDATIINLF
jgi:hypothetical protein